MILAIILEHNPNDNYDTLTMDECAAIDVGASDDRLDSLICEEVRARYPGVRVRVARNTGLVGSRVHVKYSTPHSPENDVPGDANDIAAVAAEVFAAGEWIVDRDPATA